MSTPSPRSSMTKTSTTTSAGNYDPVGVYQSPLNFNLSPVNCGTNVYGPSFFSSGGCYQFTPPVCPAGPTPFNLLYSLATAEDGSPEYNIICSNTEPASFTLMYQQKIYYLAGFHFHSPSENTFTTPDGDISFPLEMHMVYRPFADSSDTSPGVIIGVPVAVGSPSTPQFDQSLATLLTAIGNNSGEGGGSVSVSSDLFTSWQVGFLDGQPYIFPPTIMFPGSLTTPPFTEGMTWFVVNGFLVQPTITPATLALFTALRIGTPPAPIGQPRPVQRPYTRPIVLFSQIGGQPWPPVSG